MNYIGSKFKLSGFLKNGIKNAVAKPLGEYTFCDMFAGTCAVARAFQGEVGRIITNDREFYSFVLARHYIGNFAKNWDFSNLPYSMPHSKISQIRANELIENLNNEAKTPNIKGKIYRHYALGGGENRQYFSDKNAIRIDSIRIKIESLKSQRQISQDEYYFLLASLLESADKVANTASVYGAFLKNLKKSAAKDFTLRPADFRRDMGQVDSADSVDSVKLDKFGNSATLKDSAESVESRVNSADSSILKKSCGESNAEFVESRVNSANKYGESTESKIEFHTESRAESKAESHAKSAESKAKSHADSPPTNTIYEICENCEIYNENANDLIKRISGDILYLDPPYNAREYGANYHILNTIALYDDFTPRGKTGLREYEKSAFCKKNLVADALDYLIKNADFDYIFLSYNDEGLLGLGEIEEIFKKYGKYERMEQIYQRFKADSSRFCKQDSTTEYLHILQK